MRHTSGVPFSSYVRYPAGGRTYMSLASVASPLRWAWVTSKLKYRRGLPDLASLTQADASWHFKVE